MVCFCWKENFPWWEWRLCLSLGVRTNIGTGVKGCAVSKLVGVGSFQDPLIHWSWVLDWVSIKYQAWFPSCWTGLKSSERAVGHCCATWTKVYGHWSTLRTKVYGHCCALRTKVCGHYCALRKIIVLCWLLWLDRTVGCFPSLKACMVPSRTMKYES